MLPPCGPPFCLRLGFGKDDRGGAAVRISLEGKTVLVTGASRGIGWHIAREMGGAGAAVIAHYRRHREGAEEALADLPEDRQLILRGDFLSPGAGRELWGRAVEWRGRVDVLVNNAGVLPQTDWDGPDEAWDRAWETAWRVNVAEPVNLAREAVRHFADNGGGVLITLSSWLAYLAGGARTVAYSASKGAVTAFTKTAASEYARRGVTAFNIAPGTVRTDMSHQAAEPVGGEEATAPKLAMGEWIPPEEIGRLAVFLAGGNCKHLSGATIDINGASYMR